MLADALQTTFEDAVPLPEVEFVVVDLETTGGSPADSRITEIGAVKIRGGERTGVFETLVNPGVPIPRQISHLTGIDDLVVAGAPPIEWVLPSFAEFARGCVFVAHNARFDFTFLNVAFERLDYDPLPPPPVCTARLARRVVWPDVPNVRLQTLAQYFRTAVRPSHRALPDAEACSEVLHGLLELGGRLGIVTLGDLHGAVRARGRPNFGKIRLADHLPNAPGVYLFRGRDGRVLYVGKSVDLRSRVKSYFYGDGRKKVEDLLAETVGGRRRPVRLGARVPDPRGPADPRARAEVQPPGQDVAEVRLPADRRRRGVPADQGRSRDQGRRRVPRAVPLVAPRASGEGGARGRLPDPPLHDGDARVHAVRAVRARRDAPMPDSVRRARRPRALRGARPLPDLLPLHTGRAPRNARGAHARPRRAGTVRGGGAGARPLARARRGAGQEADRRLAPADRRPGPARRGGPPLPPPARRADPERRRRAPRRPVSPRAGGRALRAPGVGGSQRGPRRVERRTVRRTRGGRRRAPPAPRDAPRPATGRAAHRSDDG